jgi:hypothetical protein
MRAGGGSGSKDAAILHQPPGKCNANAVTGSDATRGCACNG